MSDDLQSLISNACDDAEDAATEIDTLRAENARLREANVRASAELRHAWKGSTPEWANGACNWRRFDANLVSKAIQILERAAATEPEGATAPECGVILEDTIDAARWCRNAWPCAEHPTKCVGALDLEAGEKE